MLPSRFEFDLTTIANLAVKTLSDEAALGLMENFETENRVLFHYFLPRAEKDVVVHFVYGKTGSCYFVKSMEIK